MDLRAGRLDVTLPRICAGIVAFNPDEARLQENLAAILPQVDRVVVVDNGSENYDRIKALCRPWPAIVLLRNSGNAGISKALNQIMAWACEVGSSWALLLDQDSVCAEDMVARLESHIQEDGVAIVAPFVQDRNLPQERPLSLGASDVDYCITSGSLCSCAVWKGLGGYDEQMFMDFVDFEYCLRVRAAGKRIVLAPDAMLLHAIGRIEKHGPFKAYHHPASRNYHLAKDMIYYARKHRHAPPGLKVEGRGVFMTGLILARKMLIVALFERDKFHKIAALVRGMADAGWPSSAPRK